MYGLIDDIQEYRKEIEALKTEVSTLRKSVANQAGDNRCWLTENVSTGIPLPPWPEFQESCHRFHTQVTAEDGVLIGCKTIAQLEAEIVRIRALFDKQYEDSMIAHRWFSQQFGDGMNGRDFAIKCQMATEEMKTLRLIAAAEKLERGL